MNGKPFKMADFKERFERKGLTVRMQALADMRKANGKVFDIPFNSKNKYQVRCRAFTSFKRLVSRNDGGGWFLFRV